jgi:hypothetical protein
MAGRGAFLQSLDMPHARRNIAAACWLVGPTGIINTAADTPPVHPEAWVLHVIRFGLDALPATPRNWRAIIIGGSIATHLKLLEAMGSIIERFGHATMVRPLGEGVQTIGDYDFH